MKKGMVTIKSAAEILNVSIETLRNWDRERKLPAERDSNGYRIYRISKLEEFAAKYKLRRRGNQKVRLII